MGQDAEQDREDLDRDRDEMPVWVQRLLDQATKIVVLLVAVVICILIINNKSDNSKAKAKDLGACIRSGRSDC